MIVHLNNHGDTTKRRPARLPGTMLLPTAATPRSTFSGAECDDLHFKDFPTFAHTVNYWFLTIKYCDGTSNLYLQLCPDGA